MHRPSTGFPQQASLAARVLPRAECGEYNAGVRADRGRPCVPMTLLGRAFLAVACGLLLAMPAVAGVETSLFRLFLPDGTFLVSYGEFVRVGDDVIFSMPVGGQPEEPRLQAVTLPASRFDWERTERYAQSVRARRYAETRGEQDFQLLSTVVASALNDVARAADRKQALAIAEGARATLADWPRAHYGYRQADVAEILALLDESISELRVASGLNAFDVSLSASGAVTAFEELGGMPAVGTQIDQLVRAGELAGRASDRVALLRSALALVTESLQATPRANELSARRRLLSRLIDQEEDTDRRYGDLVRKISERARDQAGKGRISDVERLLARIVAEDTRLGQRRPETVRALQAHVQGQVEAAQHLRLLRDQWVLRRDAFLVYRDTVRPQMMQLVRLEPALERIKGLEGPSAEELQKLSARLAGGAEYLRRLSVSADLQPTHDLIVSSWRFAESAVTARYEAVTSGQVDRAREASSAAAGSLLLLSQAQRLARELLEPPRLQ